MGKEERDKEYSTIEADSWKVSRRVAVVRGVMRENWGDTTGLGL